MHFHVRSILGAVAAVALCGAPAASAQKLNQQDRSFLTDAATGGMMEVHIGRLGAERGTSRAVKNFSEMLITDHTKANRELEALAKRKGLTWPPDDAQVASSLPLANKNGAEFDREFARIAIEDHEKDIAAFEKEINSGSDPDLKSWAERTLPTLRAHLASARTLPKE